MKIDEQNAAIRAQVERELPRPAGGFESDDAADEHRAAQDRRFAELCSVTAATLHNLKTGEYIRAASDAEATASREAAERDGGVGAIVVDGVTCYVSE